MTYYVYHKIKGDRAGGPEHYLLLETEDHAEAVEHARVWNRFHQDPPFHKAVVRTRKVREEQ